MKKYTYIRTALLGTALSMAMPVTAQENFERQSDYQPANFELDDLKFHAPSACPLADIPHDLNLMVAVGTSEDLDAKIGPYISTLPNISVNRLAAFATDGSNNHNFAWFCGGVDYVMAGASDDLDAYRKPYQTTLPKGYTLHNIVGIGVTETPEYASMTTFTFMDDGNFFLGNSDDLGHRGPYQYVMPPHKSFTDIIAVAIDGVKVEKVPGEYYENEVVYAWYADGTVSSGVIPTYDELAFDNAFLHLTSYRVPYAYSKPSPTKRDTRTYIIDIGIDGGNNNIITYYVEVPFGLLLE